MPPEPLGETARRHEPHSASDQSGSSTESPVDPPVDPPADPSNGETPFGAVRDALRKLAELETYAREYFAAKGDQFRLTLRHGIFLGAVLVLAVLIITAALSIAVVLFFMGLSGVIAVGLGGRAWAGNLIVGGGFLILVIVGTTFILAKFRSGTRRLTVVKYERRQHEQRQRFGRSSRDRAASAGKVEL